MQPDLTVIGAIGSSFRQVKEARAQAILFDLGGTFLRAGVLFQDGLISGFEKFRIQNVTHGLSPNDIWRRLLLQVTSYTTRILLTEWAHAPIVFSFPGAVIERRRFLGASTVTGKGLVDFDLAGAIESCTGRRVIFLNDVSAAAWRIAEMTTAERFLVVTVSSGIGSKIFDRSHPLQVLDSPAYAGEIGHVVVDDSADALVCDCGGRGHLGGISSGRGFERFARREAERHPQSFAQSAVVRNFNGMAETVNNEAHLVPAVLRGDEWATRVVVACTRPLVRSLLTLAMGSGLDRVFLMGGIATALGDTYLAIVRALANELCGCTGQAGIESLFESIGSEVSLEGCAAFFRRKQNKL
jgi:glucokinase